LDFLNPLYAKNDEKLDSGFGALIKHRRINANYTQQEFAQALKLSVYPADWLLSKQ
jgi:hypothetical protein